MKTTTTLSAISLLLAAASATAAAYPYAVGPITPGQPFTLAGYTYAPVSSAPASRAVHATYVTPGQPLTLAGYTYAPVQPASILPPPPPQEEPAPQPASAPWYDPSPSPSPWSVEIAAAANFATRPIMRADWEENAPKVNTYGADITLSRTLVKGLSANIRLSFASGEDSFTETDYGTYSEHYKVTDFALMPGLRYTLPVTTGTSVYLGANIGILSRSLKSRESDTGLLSPEEPSSSYTDNTTKWHDSALAFAYCAEIGLRCNITPSLALFAAYQISGSSARPKRTPQDEWDTDTYTSPRQYYNTIRLGLSYTF